MADGAAVPWDTCAVDACGGVRLGTSGRCLAHTAPEALATALAARGVDLDGRGVCFTRSAIARLLEALPRDEEGRPALGSVRLDRATFEHSVSFDDATFAGPVSMTGTTFRGDARFGGASFGGPVDCREARFAGQAWFLGASFAGLVSFAGTRFEGAAWFQRSSFAGSAAFDGALFAASLTIADTTFAGTATFAGAVFDGHVHTERASCAGGWRMDGARFRYEGESPVPPEPAPRRPAIPAAVPPPPAPAGRRRTTPPRRRARRLGAWMLPVGVLLAVAVVGLIVFRPSGEVDPEVQPEVTGSARVAFLHRQLETNQITRYDPCQPVRFVVNERSGPPGWIGELADVMTEVSALSGITFEFEGPTDEPIRADVRGQLKRAYGWPRDPEGYSEGYQDLFKRPSYQPDRYGPGRWAPVLVGWTSFGRVDAGYNKHIAGVGASDVRETAKGTVYVSGALVLNADLPMQDIRTTLMHELGHVLGLAHVGSPDEIMHAMQREQTSWGEGDKEGLRSVGLAAGCLETPAPSA